MDKENSYIDILKGKNKNIFFAISLALFGIALFIAFALTLPWNR